MTTTEQATRAVATPIGPRETVRVYILIAGIVEYVIEEPRIPAIDAALLRRFPEAWYDADDGMACFPPSFSLEVLFDAEVSILMELGFRLDSMSESEATLSREIK